MDIKRLRDGWHPGPQSTRGALKNADRALDFLEEVSGMQRADPFTTGRTDLPDRVQGASDSGLARSEAGPSTIRGNAPRAETSADGHEGTTVFENLQLVDDPPVLAYVARFSDH